jgi:hypothetical protein
MSGGFVPRFAIEAGFLILLGVGAGVADLRAIVIVGVLAAGWLLVSLIELATWRTESRPASLPVVPLGPEAQTEPQPEAEHGWPIEEDEAPGEQALAYPLRADAGSEPSQELEAYTRVLGSEREPDVSGEAER